MNKMIINTLLERLNTPDLVLIDSIYMNWICKCYFDNTEEMRELFLLKAISEVVDHYVQLDDDIEIKNILTSEIEVCNKKVVYLRDTYAYGRDPYECGNRVFDALEEEIGKIYLEKLKLPKVFGCDGKLLINTICRITNEHKIEIRYRYLARSLVYFTTNSQFNTKQTNDVTQRIIQTGLNVEQHDNYYDFLVVVMFVVAVGYDQNDILQKLFMSSLDENLRKTIEVEIEHNAEYHILIEHINNKNGIVLPEYETYSGESFMRLFSTLQKLGISGKLDNQCDSSKDLASQMNSDKKAIDLTKCRINRSDLALFVNWAGETKVKMAIEELGKWLLGDDYTEHADTWRYCLVGVDANIEHVSPIIWNQKVWKLVYFFLVLFGNGGDDIEAAIKEENKQEVKFSNGKKICEIFYINGSKGRYRNLASDWLDKLNEANYEERNAMYREIQEVVERVRDIKLNKNG